MVVSLVVIGSIACSLPFVYVLIAHADLRSLALRNAVRRRGQTVLILLGVIIATAVVTSAGVVGDSLRASVRRSAVTQLGPVDEEVLTTGIASGRRVQSAVDRSSIGSEVGTLPLLTLATTVVSDDFVARVAQAQVIEIDFARASRLGGNATATGMNGASPTGHHAEIGADLASALSTAPGHRVTVDAYGTSRTFVVERVLPRVGIAGSAPVAETTGSLSRNLFVPPGTIAAMARQGRGAAGRAQPVSVLAVSNARGRPFDTAESERVSDRLRAATVGLDAQVQPVKQLLLQDADARSSRFTKLFRAFGVFSVLGGVLLLVLTFLMLARDRARSMGILRANGLRRSRQVAALATEGWIYAVVGAALGGAAGLGIAALVVVLAHSVFATQAAGQVELVFAARSSSVAVGCGIGLVVSLVVVVCAAVVASRTNIVRMMKGRADQPRELPPAARARFGGALAAVGLVLLVAGLVASNGVAGVIGPAVAATGVVVALAAPGRSRLVTSLASVAVFAWAVLAVTVLRDEFTGLGVGVLATEGTVLSASAVALVTANHAAFTRRWSEPRGRRGLSIGLGLAYSRTSPRRSVLIVGMYAVALFTVALLVTVGQLYSHGVDAVAERLGGGAALEVTSDATRPVPVADVAALPGVTRVTATRAIDAQLIDGNSRPPVTVTVIGFDASFVGHGAPRVVGDDGNAVFRSVLGRGGNADKVIVGADLHADLQSGLPGASLRVGDSIELRDALTGATHAVTVAGLVDQARWGGADHVFTSRALVNELSRGTAPANLLYVETATGTNNGVTAAVIDGTHLQNGAYARPFATLARDALSTQREFLDVGAGYATVGLLADLAGIGVLMVDRIRERRRQIAMLLALGVAGRTLRRAFRVETAVIASEGIVVGVVSGLVLAWRLGSSGGLGSHLAFSLPLGALIAIVCVVVLASLAATSIPARNAARRFPAMALRRDE